MISCYKCGSKTSIEELRSTGDTEREISVVCERGHVEQFETHIMYLSLEKAVEQHRRDKAARKRVSSKCAGCDHPMQVRSGNERYKNYCQVCQAKHRALKYFELYRDWQERFEDLDRKRKGRMKP